MDIWPKPGQRNSTLGLWLEGLRKRCWVFTRAARPMDASPELPLRIKTEERRVEWWTDSHLNSTRLNICTHLGLKPFHPGHFRKVNHLQLIRVLFATSTIWKGLSQTLSGMATWPVAYELVEGQSVTLHVPSMPSIPFWATWSQQFLGSTLPWFVSHDPECWSLAPFMLRPPVLPSSVSQGTDPCKLWHSCFLSNRILVIVSWEAPTGDWMMGAGKKLKYLYRPTPPTLDSVFGSS